jgi:hypothetical protein
MLLKLIKNKTISFVYAEFITGINYGFCCWLYFFKGKTLQIKWFLLLKYIKVLP